MTAILYDSVLALEDISSHGVSNSGKHNWVLTGAQGFDFLEERNFSFNRYDVIL